MTPGTARDWAKEHQGNAFEGHHPEVPLDVVTGVNKMLTDFCQKIGDTGLSSSRIQGRNQGSGSYLKAETCYEWALNSGLLCIRWVYQNLPFLAHFGVPQPTIRQSLFTRVYRRKFECIMFYSFRQTFQYLISGHCFHSPHGVGTIKPQNAYSTMVLRLISKINIYLRP